MTLHLVKLSVGSESVQDQADWIAETLADKAARGLPPEHWHVTRQTPKRAAEVLAGGSLYWVIKGVIQCRQRIVDLRETAVGGVPHCAIVLDPELVLTEPRFRGPFQGWRYLDPEDAPRDLIRAETAGLPPEFVKELASLGLL